MDTPNSQFRTLNSIFSNCISQADTGSGGIYFIGAVSSIDQTCFTTCKSTLTDAIFLKSNTEGSQKIDSSSFANCPGNSASHVHSGGTVNTIFFSRGYPQILNTNFTDDSVEKNSLLEVDPLMKPEIGYSVFVRNNYEVLVSYDLSDFNSTTSSSLSRTHHCFTGNSKIQQSYQSYIFSYVMAGTSTISYFVVSDSDVKLLKLSTGSSAYSVRVSNCIFAFLQQSDPDGHLTYTKNVEFAQTGDVLVTSISVIGESICANQGFVVTDDQVNQTAILTPANIAFIAISLVLATIFTAFLLIDYCKKTFIQPEKPSNQVELLSSNEEEEKED